MMKKVLSAITRITISILMVVPFVLEPFNIVKAASGATTIQGLRQELAQLKKKKQDSENAKKHTEAEIEAKKKAIYAAYQEKEENVKKVEEAKLKIVESEEQIAKVTDETNNLLRFLQMMQGENAYMEYIAGAQTTTDLIMRVSAVEQISKYNKEMLQQLEVLIEENKKLQEDLAKREVELNNNIDNYTDKISGLSNELESLSEINEDVDTQIKDTEALITYYKSVCPNETTNLNNCVSVAPATGWLRPLNKGVITSDFGYRVHPVTGKVQSFHNAIDIGGNSEGTNVYAAASGLVAAITKKSSCGGNKVFIHHTVNGVHYTTQYLHLLEIKVKVGDVVTANTVVGTVGGGSTAAKNGGYDTCSTGAHLHYGVASGWYLKEYSSWSTFLAKSFRPSGFPKLNGRFYSRS